MIKVNREDHRISDQAFNFIQMKLQEAFNYLPKQSLVEVSLFVKRTQGTNDFAGRCWYKTFGDKARKLQIPVHIRLTASVGSNTDLPWTYDHWRIAPRKKDLVTFNTVDDVFIAILGHEVKHALLYYDKYAHTDWRKNAEAICDVHGRQWLQEWNDHQEGEKVLEQVQEFLKKNDTVDYLGTTCKVMSQFKNRHVGQMVLLVDGAGNEYRNIPYTALNKTKEDFKIVATPKKDSPKKQLKTGVINAIIDILKKGPFTKFQILDQLEMLFPDRDKTSMKNTVSTQLYVLKKKYNVVVDDSNGNKKYKITSDNVLEKHIKQLRKWNGRAQGNQYRSGSFSVAAYTKKQALELMRKAAGNIVGINYNEINDYYSECWGNDMKGIEPTEPCLYYVADHRSSTKPIRLV